ncbi:MAG: ferritin [Bacteroidota bacterium]
MLSKTVQDAINDQIAKEFYSGYVYLSMSAYLQSINLPGCAHWMRMQYQEEVGHALKLFDYVHKREGHVTLHAIQQPNTQFKSPLDVFEQALGHEREVSAMINKLYALTQKENDYPTQIELQWFITEQVEEEKNAGAIVEQIKMIGDNKVALLMLDRQLGARGAS